MLQNFCDLYDDSDDRNKLFYIICRQLSAMGIIESDDFIDELSGVRASYKRAFRDLVMQAMAAIKEQEGGGQKLLMAPDVVADDIADTALVKELPQFARAGLSAAPLPSPRSNYSRTPFSPVDFSEALDVRSRYKEDFAELKPLGKGAFGQVWRVRNRLDGVEYAIKRVKLRVGKKHNLQKILREVKFQARLSHPNVVRYYSAWLEHIDPSSPSAIRGAAASESGFSLEDTSYYGDEEEDEDDALGDSVDLTFGVGESVHSGWIEEVSTGDEGGTGSGGKVGDDTEDVEESSGLDLGLEDGSMGSRNSGRKTTASNTSASTASVRELALFIQMELCQFTLQDWLQLRNERIQKEGGGASGMNPGECLRIFRDVVEGLAYVHKMGCIHRDIKPKNIYWQPDDGLPAQAGEEGPKLREGSWKIGDFGLVTASEVASSLSTGVAHLGTDSLQDDNASAIVIPPNMDNASVDQTFGVGTVTYASPEQLQPSANGRYSSRSDMYSLGILLFELMHPCATGMERAEALTNVRRGVLPDAFVKRWPKEAALVLCLTSPEPSRRPSAAEVLEYEMLRDKKTAGKDADSSASSSKPSQTKSTATSPPPTPSHTPPPPPKPSQACTIVTRKSKAQITPTTTSKVLKNTLGFILGKGSKEDTARQQQQQCNTELEAENAALRRRVEELERELKDVKGGQ
ncbi:Eukaryotic translation initiation factor 2-alpha kinase [Rhizophlyctis rosea]|nr:Eukaryotic translation initiation factor 2-alpha kinase [Rhizophlyctis rosea]